MTPARVTGRIHGDAQWRRTSVATDTVRARRTGYQRAEPDADICGDVRPRDCGGRRQVAERRGSAAISAFSDRSAAIRRHSGRSSIDTACPYDVAPSRNRPRASSTSPSAACPSASAGSSFSACRTCASASVSPACPKFDLRKLSQDQRARRRHRECLLEGLFGGVEPVGVPGPAAFLDQRLHHPEAQELEPGPNCFTFRVDRQYAFQRGDRLTVVVQSDVRFREADERRHVARLSGDDRRKPGRSRFELATCQMHEPEAGLSR